MNIQAYKERELVHGDVVQVYRNLHKDAFSIRSKKTGLVVAHGEGFLLRDAKPVVNERIRRRVMETKVRNVHAFIEGMYDGEGDEVDVQGEIYYNPYTCTQFLLHQEPFVNGTVLFASNKAFHVEKVIS